MEFFPISLPGRKKKISLCCCLYWTGLKLSVFVIFRSLSDPDDSKKHYTRLLLCLPFAPFPRFYCSSSLLIFHAQHPWTCLIFPRTGALRAHEAGPALTFPKDRGVFVSFYPLIFLGRVGKGGTWFRPAGNCSQAKTRPQYVLINLSQRWASGWLLYRQLAMEQRGGKFREVYTQCPFKSF